MNTPISPVDSVAPSDGLGPPACPPLKKRMVHLKTKEECRLGNETIQVWTLELPGKHAEGILKVIKDKIEGQDTVDLQHLRRFAKPKFLPQHVLGKPDKIKELYSVPRSWEGSDDDVMQIQATTTWEYSTPAKSRANARPPTLHLLICPINVIGLKDLYRLLVDYPPFCSSGDSWAYPLEIKEVTVPKLSPTSPAMAASWSAEYWPTFYRKTNPFGAHPATIAKAEDNLHYPLGDNVGVEDGIALAKKAAGETERRGYGVGPGCVIVERIDNRTEIIAAAGDARFKHSPRGPKFDDSQHGCHGNVMSHAVMRAVGMVGRKRLRVASQPTTTRAEKAERNFANCGLKHDEQARDEFFLDLPVTPLEQEYFEKDNLKPDGYLCLRLEVFLTHEPCIMCSMALVHSRVGRVVFEKRMAETGGLTAELVSNDTGPAGLGYGLCWRKELNWQFMCWEYMDEKKDGDATRNGKVDDDEDEEDDGEEEKFEWRMHSLALANDNANVSSFASVHV